VRGVSAFRHLPPWCIIAFALAASLPALGLDVPPIGGIGAPGGDAKRISVFAGVSSGWDSNVPRSEDADGDTFMQTLAGLGLQFGNGRSKFELRYQARQETFSSLSTYDLSENVFLAGLDVGAEKLRLSLRGEFAELADPVDLETLTLPLLERTRTAWAPELSLEMGKVELGVGYSSKSVAYDDPAFADLDFTESALSAELRFGGRGKPSRFYMHWDSGQMDYTEDTNSDFSFQRLYLGWRGERGASGEGPALALELGAGASTVDDFSLAPSLSEQGLFALLRTTFLFGGGRSSLMLACTSGPEAAATADYKDVLRAMVRLSRMANRRWGWSVGARIENAEFANPDPSSPESLSLLVAEAGLQIEIGSPQKTHGRFYVLFSSESRTGNTAAFDYDRTRFLAGFALVH